MCAELLATQAQRQVSDRRAMQADSTITARFGAAFPFEETEDQLAAIREITLDLEQTKPMDRLLCGDVGFGKTEIAMRAAIHVVSAGKQVLLLAPTTLLAEQHHHTFKLRCKEFGIEVACLDRFRSTAERKDIISQLQLGAIDILIGTHAILSESIKASDVGLVIIDEEQRFGVKQKEALKRLASDVDMLTLSATPIPRTLHFSLLGLRAISVLAEPPPCAAP